MQQATYIRIIYIYLLNKQISECTYVVTVQELVTHLQVHCISQTRDPLIHGIRKELNSGISNCRFKEFSLKKANLLLLSLF